MEIRMMEEQGLVDEDILDELYEQYPQLADIDNATLQEFIDTNGLGVDDTDGVEPTEEEYADADDVYANDGEVEEDGDVE